MSAVRRLVYRKDPGGVRTTLTPYHFPSWFFLLNSFSECSWHGPHKINATGQDKFFTCATSLERTFKFCYRLQYCLQLKNFTVPLVACKEKADQCKFLAFQKFVKGVWVWTRVGTFSIILIIDRSRTNGSLQPLGSFFVYWCSCERIDISCISSSLDLSKTLSLRCLT